MKITPILTEKSYADAAAGKYTFKLEKGQTKPKIKSLIELIFAVKVDSVKTINYKASSRTNLMRKKVGKKAYKKAIVTLKEGSTIDIFGTNKKEKSKK